MADIIVVNNKSELYNVINQKKTEGYLETELAVISKSKLHLDDLHNSQISMIATSGSFSDRMSRLLTGEDGEEAVLSRYNLTEEQLEEHKQDILDNKLLLVANRDNSSHDEVEDHNAAYKEIDITHYAAESKGPKS